MNNHSSLIHSVRPTNQVMRLVSIALLPGIFAQVYFLGWGVLINLVLCSIYAISAETFVLKLRKRPIKQTLSDNSAWLTGLLIGVAIPPILPWWMSLVGVWFAIIFAKQLYGGLGFNPFNPAMVGYVLLLISFPVEMTSWLPNAELASTNQITQPNFLESLQLILVGTTSQGLNLQDFRQLADGYTMATPLDESKTAFSLGLMTSEIMNEPRFLPNFSAWFWINICFMFGGLYLLASKLIRWQIPTAMLMSMIITATFLNLFDNELFIPAWLHLFSGATMIGAFFIATDPVSAATTPKGRLIYGAAIGFFVIIIRTFGGYPDAVAFAVLLLNIAAPTIDHYTKPTIYGSQTENRNDV